MASKEISALHSQRIAGLLDNWRMYTASYCLGEGKGIGKSVFGLSEKSVAQRIFLISPHSNPSLTGLLLATLFLDGRTGLEKICEREKKLLRLV